MKVQYRPGRQNTADYLSRHPHISAKENHRSWIDIQTEYAYINAIQVYEAEGLSCEMIRDSTSSDSLMQELIDAIITQRWHKRSEGIKPYQMLKTELSIVNGLVMRGDRIIVPNKYQQRAVDIAHSSHQGMTKTKNLMRETLWFPGMDTMIEREVKACLPCQAATHGSLNKEPLKMSKLPEGPWKEVSLDFCGPFPS